MMASYRKSFGLLPDSLLLLVLSACNSARAFGQIMVSRIFCSCCLYCECDHSVSQDWDHYADWVIGRPCPRWRLSWSPLLSAVFSSPTPRLPWSQRSRDLLAILSQTTRVEKNNLLCALAFHITTVIRRSLVYWYFHGILTFSLHLLCIRSESRQICWYR